MTDEDQTFCTLCSEPFTGEGFLITAPWPEVQQVCSLTCLEGVAAMWRDAEADGRLAT